MLVEYFSTGVINVVNDDVTLRVWISLSGGGITVMENIMQYSQTSHFSTASTLLVIE
jgi:hypothetical protein